MSADRTRFASSLADRIDEAGFARFPHAGVGEWEVERLERARRDLARAIDDVESSGRRVEVFDVADATIVRWSSERP